MYEAVSERYGRELDMSLFSCGKLTAKNCRLYSTPTTSAWRLALLAVPLAAAGVMSNPGYATATMIGSASAGAYASTNWSGYADVVSSSSSNTFTAVSGQWTVPTVIEPTGSSSAYSAFWVGLDGFNSNTVEQTGIEAQISGNTTTYYAWYEMYPLAETPINSITVNPGDTITASVNYNTSTGNFTLAINDVTSGGSYSISEPGSGDARSSAEWIAEAPTIQNRDGSQSLTTLANFGSVVFSNASVSIANSSGTVTTGSISAISSLASVDSIQMQTSGGKLEAIPSGLRSNGSAFTVTYVPEPAPLALLAFGAAAISLLRRRAKLPQ